VFRRELIVLQASVDGVVLEIANRTGICAAAAPRQSTSPRRQVSAQGTHLSARRFN